MNKSRYYGLDILRIVSMFGIIGLHVLGKGGILLNTTQGTVNYYIAWFLEICFYCSVNTFAMLTGFLYIGTSKENMKSSSIVKLLLTTMFYCIVIFLCFLLFRPSVFENVGVETYLTVLCPPFAGTYWYITSYTLVFFMIPYINMIINGINKKALQKLIILLFLFFSVITTFGLRDFWKINNGYSPFWLIFCYVVGAYIKLYGFPHKLPRYALFGIFIGNVILLLLSKSVTFIVFAKLVEYVSPLVFANAVLLFAIFKDITLKKNILKKVVVQLSNAAFGAYIIHANILIFNHWLKDRFVYMINENSLLLIGKVVVAIFLIYIFCWLVEVVRRYIFKLSKLDLLISKVGNKIDSILK